MEPSKVRELIERDHVQIRILLADVDDACRRAIEADGPDPRPRVVELVRVLWNHLVLEDRLLVPTLRGIDAWGPVRADAVAREHVRQRQELVVILDGARRQGARELAAATRRLVAELRTDMDAEERDLLDPKLLRDDVILTDGSGS